MYTGPSPDICVSKPKTLCGGRERERVSATPSSGLLIAVLRYAFYDEAHSPQRR